MKRTKMKTEEVESDNQLAFSRPNLQVRSHGGLAPKLSSPQIFRCPISKIVAAYMAANLR